MSSKVGGSDPTIAPDPATDATMAPDLATEATMAPDPATEEASGNAAAAPTVVAGRYEILGLLGAGGMGRVYRARDRELGEVVALKVLHRDLVGSDEMVERFRQEVRLARRVTHRNVARTFDIGDHEGEKFLTMEFVAGEPLSARLAREILPIADAVAIAREMVAGIGAAHAAGVVHRDLKPDNVLLGRDGRVVVTDFGIARTEAPDDASRTSGRIIGTPVYMAPEQVSGVPVDARADIYAFGAILFEMLTGHRAWSGTSAIAVASARLVHPPPDPRTHRPGLSPSLAELVLRCLARDRDDRFASADELDRAIAAADPSAEGGAPTVRRPVLSEARERTVAVLPFRNLGSADDAHFVDGLVEDLVDVLATVRGLRVRGRGFVDSGDGDVVETGRRLGVNVVVAGSVRRANDQLRVNARVVGVTDGFQIWSERFDGATGGAFALNDQVVQAIATALSADHTEARRAQLTDPVAIDLYFRARHAIGRFWTVEGMEEAAALFKQALERAPEDPTILAGYISAQIGRNFFAPLDSAEATVLLRRALRAGERMHEPWVALAAVRFNHHDDPGGALRALRRALALAPSSAEAHDLAGRILLEADQMDEAVRYLDRTLWLDPRQRWARVDLMRAAALTGDWAKARAIFESGPGSEWIAHRAIHEARLWSWTGAPPIERGPPESIVDVRLRKLFDLYALARTCRDTGRVPDVAEIRGLLEPMMQRVSRASRSRRFFLQLGAEASAIAGQLEGALGMVDDAVQAGLFDLAWMNRLRVLDPLRGDARFEALRTRVEERAKRVVAEWHAPEETLAQALKSLG